MKYCIYCGFETNENMDICLNCGENISDEEVNKLIQSNVECIKCHSKNVSLYVTKKRKNNIVFEDERYVCNECGRKFTTRERLGHSFSNSFQLMLSTGEKKVIKWLFAVCIIAFLIIQNGIKINNEQNSWTRIDYTGLPTMTFKEIKEEANTSLDTAKQKYLNNSYIFTTTIQSINGREIITPIEEGDYSGSYIYVNNEDMEKLKNYKEGDAITIAGTVYKISLYHKVYVKNATIVEE